jgi:hypothetical protein
VCDCLIDEGRPLGTAGQEQVPNHLRGYGQKPWSFAYWQMSGVDHTAPQGLFRHISSNLARSSRLYSMPSLLCSVSIWALPALF